MRINGIGNVNELYKPGKSTKTYDAKSVSGGKDSLAISDFAKDLQVAKQSVKSAPDIRQARVDDIKSQMEAGKYNVSASQVAEKLVNKYFE
ncbi:MAG: flagellar biosynthesis anti-sigma factor FlgM [Vallitaleaceae bacterium]|jgi:negative regulator of flagellin synthesis FlgM|nr:flagellar biosynthesis anti-sigma factor FlgM [Vallitaleaceae bacterium]